MLERFIVVMHANSKRSRSIVAICFAMKSVGVRHPTTCVVMKNNVIIIFDNFGGPSSGAHKQVNVKIFWIVGNGCIFNKLFTHKWLWNFFLKKFSFFIMWKSKRIIFLVIIYYNSYGSTECQRREQTVFIGGTKWKTKLYAHFS